VTTQATVEATITKDLQQFSESSRRFQRYFTLHTLANAGLGQDELQSYRNALAKLCNSLSWHPKLRNPEPIDTAKLILRIDLRWFLWDATLWNRLLAEYPYGILTDSAVERVMQVQTGTRLPILRADWFIATASRAPLYYDLLQMPGNLPELERQLRVDANANILQERVQRVGFNGSGVSRFNRILERHPAAHGFYWRTYDFDEPPQSLLDRTQNQQPDRRNIFAYPLGPGNVAESFQHAGGEAIFTLPNGLHGYIIVNADNERIDKAPVAIVSDPKRPDRAVEAGVSCMSCHITGILPKADQVRDHVTKHRSSFSRTDAELVAALYPDKASSTQQMEDDAKAYAEVVAQTGAKASRTEAVSSMTLKFEADLDLCSAAGEVMLPPEALRSALSTYPELKKNLGALGVPGGTVSRAIWQQAFGDLVRVLHLGTLFQANASTALRPDGTAELNPIGATSRAVLSVAWHPDGKQVLYAGEDQSLTLWDTNAQRLVRTLSGHTARVSAVGIAGDGRTAISGALDGTVKHWKLDDGQERRSLEGHSSLVSSVLLNSDGSHALTVGYDGTAIWWNTTTGTELQRYISTQPIHAVSMHPKQSIAALAVGEEIVVWNAKTGEVQHHWQAHVGAVTALHYTNGGTLLCSGGDDGSLKVWSPEHQMQHTIVAHRSRVCSLTTSDDGRFLLSASTDGTVVMSSLEQGKLIKAFTKHRAAVVRSEFTQDGSTTRSMDATSTTLRWDITKLLSATPTVAPQSPIPDTIPIIK
jgi:WD40 repeat protein